MRISIPPRGTSIMFLKCLFIVLSYINAIGQLTINVISIPASTPPGDDIYIAGNFNNWNPGNPAYVLTKDQSGIYSITITPSPGTLEFKFTRGSWETVEGTANGTYIPNRTYSYNGTAQYTNLTIAGWEGKGGVHTAADNVMLLDDDFYIPQLNRTRKIWIYLPPDYETTSKRYPVLYMQDGQNLFDEALSFAGTEWAIDESMNELADSGDYGAIIVGIENGPQRIDEYSPWVNHDYGGGQGEAYSAFIVNTLKPYVDSVYRTLPGRDYTGIGGSSLGANLSMFAAVEYQDVFSKVGIFSPAFWFSDSIYQHIVSTGIHQELKIYFIAGANESSTVISDMQAVYDTLVFAGEDEMDMHFISTPDGAHNEWFWAREYPAAYEWLFGELVLNTKSPKEKKGFLFPNPADESIWLNSDDVNVHVTIYSITGQVMETEETDENRIDISNLPSGIYFIEVQSLSAPDHFISRFVKL